MQAVTLIHLLEMISSLTPQLLEYFSFSSNIFFNLVQHLLPAQRDK